MYRHHALIDQAITDTIRHKTEPILLVETPVRHGKSEHISKYTPAWFLGMYPEKTVLFASATQPLASQWGGQARDIYREYSTILFGRRYGGGTTVDWNTGHGGGMVSAGIGGSHMGRNGDLLIIDDYLKSASDALSEVISENQWNWWQSAFSSRLEPGGSIIILATRWGENDLIGRLIDKAESGEGLPIRRLRLPAIAEEDVGQGPDPLGRQPGEALWPERWPVGDPNKLVKNAWGEMTVGLAMRKKITTPYWWNAVYQQRPSVSGLAEWPDEYFGSHIWPATWPSKFEVGAVAVDPSKGVNSKAGDYSAIVFVGIYCGKLYVDAHLEKMGVPLLIHHWIRMVTSYKPDIHGVEANQFQELLAPDFNEAAASMNLFQPPALLNNQSKKELRISGIGPYLDNRMLLFRPNRPTVKLLVQQLKGFPHADFDDGPDALEMALRLLRHLVTVEDTDYDQLLVTT